MWTCRCTGRGGKLPIVSHASSQQSTSPADISHSIPPLSTDGCTTEAAALYKAGIHAHKLGLPCMTPWPWTARALHALSLYMYVTSGHGGSLCYAPVPIPRPEWRISNAGPGNAVVLVPSFHSAEAPDSRTLTGSPSNSLCTCALHYKAASKQHGRCTPCGHL